MQVVWVSYNIYSPFVRIIFCHITDYIDPSIATASLGIGPKDLINDLKTMGLIFETLAIVLRLCVGIQKIWCGCAAVIEPAAGTPFGREIAQKHYS